LKTLAWIWAGLTVLFAAIEGLDRALPPPIGITTSSMVTDREGRPLRIFPVEDGRWRVKASLEDIDPRLIEALILVEDKRFYEHRGVDLRAFLRAIRSNLQQGEIVSGASTITMQTARLLEPRPRTLRSKFLEMLRAKQIERRLSKAEIVELYLTLTPYGGNLEGVASASLAYFGKQPRALTDDQIALLLALPQSPEARRPDLRPKGAAKGRKVILSKLNAAGFLSSARAKEAASASLPQARRNFPSDAWHVSGRLARPGQRVESTIDRQIQETLHRILSHAAEAEGPAVQAAGMVVDLQTRQVLASIGSTHRQRPGGWLDLTRRKRSPGSTLKPLVYGLAMQEGIVRAETRIADLPSRFGTYEPQNFARDFAGELTVGDALRHSLNVPAVLILDRLGPDRLLGAMRQAGMSPDMPMTGERESGLAVTLGGVGVTMEELLVLYTALGTKGLARPLKFQAQNGEHSGVRIMSEEAAEEVLEILRAAPAVRGRLPALLSASAPNVAAKTGTSYGFRDAWAAGVSERYAAIVWLGRADGSARPGRTGRAAALPVLFELFDAIGGPEPWTPATKDLVSPGQALTARQGPQITFPPDGALLYRRADGFVLAGRGTGELRWYADGQKLLEEYGQTIWNPPAPGFYRLSLADDDGSMTEVTVQVTDSAG
jgi:penicillin-binding protein 1C